MLHEALNRTHVRHKRRGKGIAHCDAHNSHPSPARTNTCDGERGCIRGIRRGAGDGTCQGVDDKARRERGNDRVVRHTTARGHNRVRRDGCVLQVDARGMQVAERRSRIGHVYQDRCKAHTAGTRCRDGVRSRRGYHRRLARDDTRCGAQGKTRWKGGRHTKARNRTARRHHRVRDDGHAVCRGNIRTHVLYLRRGRHRDVHNARAAATGAGCRHRVVRRRLNNRRSTRDDARQRVHGKTRRKRRAHTKDRNRTAAHRGYCRVRSDGHVQRIHHRLLPVGNVRGCIRNGDGHTSRVAANARAGHHVVRGGRYHRGLA